MSATRVVLAAAAFAVTAFAGVKAVRGGAAALGAFGFVVTCATISGALAVVPGSPGTACLLLHYGVTVGAKTAAIARTRGGVPFARGVAFLLVYPGLDPRRAFVHDPKVRRARGVATSLVGAFESVAAFAIPSVAARLGVLDLNPWTAALFLALALYLVLDGVGRVSRGLCEVVGTDAEPSFDRPWRAKDLAEFWGRRWNAFIGRTLFHEVYRPTARRLGAAGASLLAFEASGAMHEVLYGLPAGAALGNYLLFFGIQWIGVVVSSRIASPSLRRVLMWTFLVAPAPLFFGGAFRTAFPIERALR